MSMSSPSGKERDGRADRLCGDRRTHRRITAIRFGRDCRPAQHGQNQLSVGHRGNAAIKHEQVIGIFSLEMSKPQIVLRMLSSEARVDSHAFGRADYKRKIGGALRKPPENSNRRRFLSTIQAR